MENGGHTLMENGGHTLVENAEGKTGATPLENYSHAQQGEARSPGTSPASVCHIFEYVTSPVVHYGIVGRRRVRAIARNIVFCRDHRPRDAKPAFRDALS